MVVLSKSYTSIRLIAVVAGSNSAESNAFLYLGVFLCVA